MTVRREGGCACGAIRYRLASDPLFVHCCHCLNCQRQTGSAFVINLLIEADRVELLAGEPQPVAVPRGSKKQTIWRCPDMPDRRLQPATRPRSSGSSAGARSTTRPRVEPDVHIYTRSKLPWVVLPPSTPAFSTYYDTEKLWPPESLERWAALR